jgi:AraC-like DNA-binding protein
MDLERGSQAVQTLLTLYAEARNSRRLNPYWASSQLYAFLMELYRELEREAEALAIPEGIWRSRQCIEDRFSEPHLCVNELASAAGYSRYHYTRLFSRAFHMSPYDYLLQVRLENAQRYLESTNHSVEQISSLCGFAEAGNFRRALKRRTGLTPSQIRKRSGAPLASRMPQHSKRGRGE